MFNFFKKVPSVSTKELAERLNNKMVLLDVRTPQEFRQGHIAQAQNVPLNKLPNYAGKEKEVYVICQSGMRSKQGAKILQGKGYQVTNIRGGMNMWSGPRRVGK